MSFLTPNEICKVSNVRASMLAINPDPEELAEYFTSNVRGWLRFIIADDCLGVSDTSEHNVIAKAMGPAGMVGSDYVLSTERPIHMRGVGIVDDDGDELFLGDIEDIVGEFPVRYRRIVRKCLVALRCG